jgi:hypothetical protein
VRTLRQPRRQSPDSAFVFATERGGVVSVSYYQHESPA